MFPVPPAPLIALLGVLALAACSVSNSAPLQRPTRPGQPLASPQEASALSHTPSASPSAQTTPAPKASSSSQAKSSATQGKQPGSSAHPSNQYVPFAPLAATFGYKILWTEPEKKFQLKTRAQTLEFEVNSRDHELGGLRVFFGEPIRMIKGEPHLSRIDADRILTPFLRPGYGVKVPDELKTIVLDPGHGGKDAGKVSESLKIQEKTLTLDTALRLKKLLEADGYKVVLTRSDDRSIELPERPEVAEKAGADLFISIHFNSVENGAERVTGVETFSMTPKNQLSTSLEADQYVHVANPGNVNDHWNFVLASSIHRKLLGELKASDRGLKRARWAVLRLAPCPAVLVESGYISNEAEAKKLLKGDYRQRIAEAIAEGVRAYALSVETARRLGKAQRR